MVRLPEAALPPLKFRGGYSRRRRDRSAVAPRSSPEQGFPFARAALSRKAWRQEEEEEEEETGGGGGVSSALLEI